MSEQIFETLESGTSEDTSFPKYSLILLLSLNTVLIIFLSYKIFKLCFQSTTSYFEKKNTSYRFQTFVLILIALVLREMAYGLHLYTLVSKDKPSYYSSLLLISDTFPALLFITLATTSAYYWHETYRSYDQMYERIKTPDIRRKCFKIFLVIFNTLLYICFTVLMLIYIFQKSIGIAYLMKIILIPCLFLSLILLLFHGNALHDKTVMLVNYTGRKINTGGFKVIYGILLFCCTMKGIQEVIMLSLSGNDEMNISLSLFIAYLIIFEVIGEFLAFFALVLLLEKNANKYRAEGSSTLIPKAESEDESSNDSLDVSRDSYFEDDVYLDLERTHEHFLSIK